MLLTRITTLDALLDAHAADLADDFTGYRNHTYRVANLCAALTSGDPETLEKIAIAAALHDMGIWTAGTFDYLQPSVELAAAWLARAGRAEWIPEITEMILQHHKILPVRSNPHWLVEAFRRSDWADVSRGLIAFGISRKLMGELYAKWPGAGFHKRLAALQLKRVRTHP